MKIVLLQLSDIHITEIKNRVFSRSEHLVSALNGLGFQADICIVVVTGDIAYSGKIEEYADSLQLFEDLRVNLPKVLNVSQIEFVAIPGNHDCDFSLDTKARRSTISMVKQDDELDSSVIEAATIVQRDFFALLKVYFSKNIEFISNIKWNYIFKINESKILFNCFNTAWVSELKEKPGMMYYPVEAVTDNYGYDLVISLLHHPYNWISPNNSRALRKRIEAVSDIILTGHEHDSTAITNSNLTQESTHIEAGALQESWDSKISDFNCILLDTEKHKRAVLPFKWNGIKYYSVYSIDSQWETYQENPARKTNEFGLSEEFKIWLDDLGIQLQHPQKGVLTREEIFIFPDLFEIGIRHNKGTRTTNSEKFYSVLSETGKAILTGSSDSGKTTLCKELFKHFYDKELIPIYIDGALGKTLYPDGRLVTLLGRECEETYNNLTIENYRQLDKEKRVIIIDNFEKVGFKSGKRTAKELLDFLSSIASTVILAANEVSVEASEVLQEGLSFVTEGEAAFKQFKIQPFGHVLRERLVEKWVSFDVDIDDEKLFRQIHEIKSLLDTVIGNNFIPPYPIILLPLLQATQFHDALNPAASTYGYFYELLINRSLTEKSSKIAISIKAGYLTYLAKFMFEKNINRLSNSECLTFHQEYEDKYDITINYREIIPLLVETSLLEESLEGIKFRYEYIYYYYVAKSLSSRLYDINVQNTISKLIDGIHIDTNANTLLFLTHITNDQFIVTQMIQAASKVFPTINPIYNFQGISSLDSKELDEIRENLYKDEDIRLNRRRRNEYLDEVSNDKEGANGADEDIMHAHTEEEQNIALTESQMSYMLRIGVAMKTLQILGQLLRNHVGTMERDVKSLLVKECVGIGLRTLNSLIQSLEPHKESLVRELAIVFKEENPELTSHAAANQAINSLFQIVHNNTFSTIKRISNAIGSPRLTPTYDRLFLDSASPIERLIHAALYFDNTATFPLNVLEGTYNIVKDIPIGLSILKTFTYQQFYTFNIPTKTKQKAFNVLQITYNPKIGTNPKEKLLKK